MRNDNRSNNDLRPIKITPNVNRYAEGSVLIEVEHTKIHCTVSIDDGVPKWLTGTGQGWVTAEYGMLPRSTHTRMRRERAASSGRTQEISRLIARSLRAVTDLKGFGERTINVDCDVMQADGGTRCAAITGGFVALALAFEKLKGRGEIEAIPLTDYLAATSIGVSNHEVLVDLNYEEDSSVETDMNVVMTGKGAFVEIQGTAEGTPFTNSELSAMTEAARNSLEVIFGIQESLISSFYPRPK